MKIVRFKGAETGSPDSAEWHAWRAQGIGGSDALSVAVEAGLATDPPSWAKSAHALWELKTGQKEDTFKGNWATKRGQAGEAIIRKLYENQTGIPVTPMFGEMDGFDFIRSSFDGLAFDFSTIVEIKCPSEAVHNMALNNEVVGYYKPQLLHQALTAWGVPETWHPDHESHFVTGIPEKKEIAIVRIPARAMREKACRLFEAEQAFWKKVQDFQPPAGDGWIDMAELWKAAHAAIEQAKAEKAVIEGMMIDYITHRNMLQAEGGGVRMRKESRKGSVDYAKVLKAHGIELEDEKADAFRKASSESWVARQLKE